MTRQGRHLAEMRERAVRMVFEHEGEHASPLAAITSIAAMFGVLSESLRLWVRRAETNDGLQGGLTSTERQHVKELEHEVRELRHTKEILKTVATFFAADLDRRPRR